MEQFGDYVIYADESGDHSLTKIDDSYPVFVLCLCIFKKTQYTSKIVPAMQRLKFKYFGHDAIIFHERDIRKQEGDFKLLSDLSLRNRFMSDLDGILEASKFKILACAIDKSRLTKEYLFQENPYSIALAFCIDRCVQFLEKEQQAGKSTHFIFEKRGEKEDKELELTFRRIADGDNKLQRKLNDINIKFLDKRANCSGMQIADLTARPIGLHVIRPLQSNRAFAIISKKILKPFGKTRKTRGIITFP
jgi:hypothetical protein